MSSFERYKTKQNKTKNKRKWRLLSRISMLRPWDGLFHSYAYKPTATISLTLCYPFCFTHPFRNDKKSVEDSWRMRHLIIPTTQSTCEQVAFLPRIEINSTDKKYASWTQSKWIWLWNFDITKKKKKKNIKRMINQKAIKSYSKKNVWI